MLELSRVYDSCLQSFDVLEIFILSFDNLRDFSFLNSHSSSVVLLIHFLQYTYTQFQLFIHVLLIFFYLKKNVKLKIRISYKTINQTSVLIEKISSTTTRHY